MASTPTSAGGGRPLYDFGCGCITTGTKTGSSAGGGRPLYEFVCGCQAGTGTATDAGGGRPLYEFVCSCVTTSTTTSTTTTTTTGTTTTTTTTGTTSSTTTTTTSSTTTTSTTGTTTTQCPSPGGPCCGFSTECIPGALAITGGSEADCSIPAGPCIWYYQNGSCENTTGCTWEHNPDDSCSIEGLFACQDGNWIFDGFDTSMGAVFTLVSCNPFHMHVDMTAFGGCTYDLVAA